MYPQRRRPGGGLHRVGHAAGRRSQSRDRPNEPDVTMAAAAMPPATMASAAPGRGRRGRVARIARIADIARIARVALVIAGTALAACSASAQTAFTVYGGLRSGAELTDARDGGRTLRLRGGGAWSASLDWPAGDDGRQIQLFVSHQRSELPGRAFGRPQAVAIDIGHVHLGGRSFFGGDARRGGGYVVGGIGVAHFSPGLDGLASETRPAMNVGVGHQWTLAPAVALRAELRAHLTLLDSRGGLFCSGGCIFQIRGDTLVQAEAMFGLSVGF
jgi:hypothetical protein